MFQITLHPFTRDDTDWLVSQHATAYARDEGFDDSFGPLVRRILEDFADAHDPSCEAGWIAWSGSQRLGSVFCVRQSPGVAKLRLFYTEPSARGTGLGRHLLETCLNFARSCGYERMELWTHESHAAACALYEKYGFEAISRTAVHSFGVDLIEIIYGRDL